MIFICSRGRRKCLERFFEKSKPVMEGRVLIDDDDQSYDGMILPENWSFRVGKRMNTRSIINSAFQAFPDEPWYAVVCDDMIYTTPGWDVMLSRTCGNKRIAWGDDGRFHDGLCTSFFIGGDLVRSMGWLVCPTIGHLYGDTIWWMIAKGAKVGIYVPEVTYTHIKEMDKTYLERSIRGDKEAFEKLRSNGLSELIKKAHELDTVHIT